MNAIEQTTTIRIIQKSPRKFRVLKERTMVPATFVEVLGFAEAKNLEDATAIKEKWEAELASPK